MNKPRAYYRFSNYLKDRFGCSVFKISIDAGFSCPNIDGTKSSGGCIYCNNSGFSFNTRDAVIPLDEQMRNGIEFAGKRYKADKYIAYFQAFTNTYSTVEILKQRYDTIRTYKDIVGLSIGTRPDCIDDAKLNLIEEYANDYEVWIEYGLQSANDEILNREKRVN
jgi:radical SAM protein (TIGR01212 family)